MAEYSSKKASPLEKLLLQINWLTKPMYELGREKASLQKGLFQKLPYYYVTNGKRLHFKVNSSLPACLKKRIKIQLKFIGSQLYSF